MTLTIILQNLEYVEYVVHKCRLINMLYSVHKCRLINISVFFFFEGKGSWPEYMFRGNYPQNSREVRIYPQDSRGGVFTPRILGGGTPITPLKGATEFISQTSTVLSFSLSKTLLNQQNSQWYEIKDYRFRRSTSLSIGSNPFSRADENMRARS